VHLLSNKIAKASNIGIGSHRFLLFLNLKLFNQFRSYITRLLGYQLLLLDNFDGFTTDLELI